MSRRLTKASMRRFYALAAAGFATAQIHNMLECECRQMSANRIVQYDDGPNKGLWHIRLQTCGSSEPRIGPYQLKADALRDIPVLQNQIDWCMNRLAGAIQGQSVPYIDYIALKVELELAYAKMGELEHEVLQLKSDNENLIHYYGIAEFQDRIHEYLQHASGSDDVLRGGTEPTSLPAMQ